MTAVDWLPILVSFLPLAQSLPSIYTLDLHPTAQLARKRRRLRSNTNLTTGYPSDWFHPKSSAVYATLPKIDEDHSDDPRILDFHQHRHLSRWERHFRTELGLDLQLEWNGTYRLLEEEEKTRHGGRFNNYASAPLSQGYGTHYANLWVGSPKAQRKSVIVDTGSHYTAFPCKGCVNCGEEHHTDPYFDPDLSESFRRLACHECRLGATCRDRKCYFSQSYTEGSSWEAQQVEDYVYLGGRDFLAMADPRNMEFAIKFMFGCQTSESGLFVTQLADGIMGMSAHEFTLTKQMYEKKKVEHNMFALCFRRELGVSKKGITAGIMTIGGMDSRLDSSPTLFAKNIASTGWFTIYVQNIFIRAGGGQKATSVIEEGQHVLKIPLDLAAVNSGKGVIVDSGTTDTYLHKKLAKSFASVWKTVTKKDYSHSALLLSDDQLRRLPTILIQMTAFDSRKDPSQGPASDTIGYAGNLDPTAPYDILLAIPATNYMEYSPTTGLYTSRLYFTETQGGVLGANAMQGHNVVFDWENGRIGFSESTCDYQDEHSALRIKGTHESQEFSNDCVMAKPVMKKACIENLDTSSCQQNPNQFLAGTEIWIRAVERYGTDSGMSCQDIVLLDTPHRGELPPHIECMDGLCAEFRPCQISCQDVAVATKNLESQGNPCPSAWSACDESCKQSLIHSTLRADGICHATAHSIRRDCHIGACGKDDPCRVPYLVHVTLGFRGADRNLWTTDASETLARSLVETVRHVGKMDKVPFSEGDVNIMMSSPWHEEKEGDHAVEIGLKIVVQISFFNENAKFIGKTQEDKAEPSNHRRRHLPLIDNESLFSQSKQKSTCVENDLYPLAHSALSVHSAIQNEHFMWALMGEMKRAEGGDQNYAKSPFNHLYNENDLITQSHVISSWTIRTEVEESASVKKSILERSPLARFSLDARTIWLGLTVVGLLLLYIADRYYLQPADEERNKSNKKKQQEKMTTAQDSSHTSNSEESEMLLFKQLFRPQSLGSNHDLTDDESTQASSLLGKSVTSIRRTTRGGVELASSSRLFSSRKKAPTK